MATFKDALILLKDTPVPTILIFLGALFLFVGIITLDKPITINLKDRERAIARGIGAIILISGIALYALPFFLGLPHSPQEPALTITPTLDPDFSTPATHTPEIRPTLSDTPSPPPTSELSFTPTEETFTLTPPPSPTASPSSSPTPTTILGGNNCISAGIWTPYQGFAPPINLDGCWQAEKHGLFTTNNLIINVKDLKTQKLYGVYTTIPTTTEIKFAITIDKLVTQNGDDGNIAFAIVPADTIAPTYGAALLFQVETSPPNHSPILLKVHERNKPQMEIPNLPVYQFGRTYYFSLQLTASSLYIYLNGEQVAGPVGVSFPNRVLWVGYTIPTGAEIIATISDLTIAGK